MKGASRLALVTVLVLGSVGAFMGLTRLSRGSEGPLASLLSRIGAAVGALEHRLRVATVGEGRARRLAWFAGYRDSVEWLRRPDRVLLGAFDEGLPSTLDGVGRLESAIGATLPIVQLYSAWGDKPEQQFPRVLAGAVRDYGSLPLITWEPWLTDFDVRLHTHLRLREARDLHGLADVARGDYDFYIDRWATDARDFGAPLMIRMGHEMNDPYRYPWGPQHNTKEEYIAAWRHVVDRFRAMGAHNVLWVWSPHVAYPYWDLYYPGDAWVDWVATGVLNFGPIARWSEWWTFQEIFGTHYPKLEALGKPIMIAELGSLAVGGDRAAWYRDALTDLPSRFPALKALLFFHTSSDQTVTYQKADWTLTTDSATAAAVAASVRSWAPGGPER